MAETKKVFFTKSVEIQPITKGLYSDPMKDTTGFRFIVLKGKLPSRRRAYGDDPEYDAVMHNFGQTADDSGAYPEQQLVFGYANVALQENGEAPLDWQGDAIDPEVLESTAYNYVLKHGLANQEHEWGTECGWLVESMMFTKAKMQALGIPEGLVPEAWWVGFYIPDKAVFNKVKNGDYNMFSIEGHARRIPVDDGIPTLIGNQ